MQSNNIRYLISKSIKEGKWLEIFYHNKEDIKTLFWCSILDIDEKKLHIKMFNITKGLDVRNGPIKFDRILSARIIDFTGYEVPKKLLDKLDSSCESVEWLGYDKFNHNVLLYLAECNNLDSDPYQEDYCLLPGVDCEVLKHDKEYKLSSEQIKILVKNIKIFDHNKKDNTRFKEMAINELSIFERGKYYVVAYYRVYYDVDKKSLKLDPNLIFNKSFLIEGKRHSLVSYLEMDINDFTENYENNKEEFRQLLMHNLYDSELVTDSPSIMVIEKEYKIDLFSFANSISEQKKEKLLKPPLKAFFGDVSTKNNGKKEPSIIVIDKKKTNIDQMRVVYNTMKNAITYVQGPPGTGKTTTILNVILTAFFSNRTCLIVSNNNKPINGILEKIKFKYQDKDILFPILRIGNLEENLKACEHIKELYDGKYNIKIKENLINAIKERTNDNYGKLTKVLKDYEDRVLIEEKLENAKGYLKYIFEDKDEILEKTYSEIRRLEEELKKIPIVSNEDAVSCAVSALDDKKFLQYLYYESFKYIMKLQQPAYKDLITIVNNKDEVTKNKEFNQYLKDEEKLKKLLLVFPFIVTTNISANKLALPKPYFNLCIMDEAGQSNIATALLPISRAEKLLLVGDQNQLQPVIVLEDAINKKLKEKYSIGNDYDYCQLSILTLYLQKDSISRRVFLRYHYRCARKIIKFCNDRYYGSKLDISLTDDTNSLEFINVQNGKSKEKNSYNEEASAIVDYLQRNKIKDCQIITPFRAQARLINKMLHEKGLNHVKAGTIHTVQGDEKDVIIFSTAISLDSSKKNFEWVATNKELINVAATRSKKKFVMVGDLEAINTKSSVFLENNEIYELTKYVKNNGDYFVPKSSKIIEIGKSNGSRYEDYCFETVQHICSLNPKIFVRRNVPLTEVFDLSQINEYKNYYKRAEFDQVIYKKKAGKYIPRLIIEINGGEHLFGKNEGIKSDICLKKGLKFAAISNKQVMLHSTLSHIILTLTKNDE